jgi:uncharacterized membrane protein YdjX (TVP38/TMEM64 family)
MQQTGGRRDGLRRVAGLTLWRGRPQAGVMTRAGSNSHVLKIALGALVLLALGGAGLWWFKIHDYSVRLSIDAGITVLRDAGPLVFFCAMALLPAIGFPIFIFNVTAGTAFAERMGLPAVLLAAGAAILVNLSLTYWLARYTLRPWLLEMIGRTRYKIPVVAAADHGEITLLLRITPGPPFFLQSYLLGLAEVSFFTYLWISWTVSMIYSVAFIVFGDAILHGKARLAFLGLSVLVAAGLIVHLLRRHYGKKRA